LIYAMGGPNEEDNAYPQSQGATLPDATLVQTSLYEWAHSKGRNLPVSQMEFGSGWTAANGWHGDYDPQNTGLHQNYAPGPADVGGAHTYLSNPNQRPQNVLDQIRALARLATPSKPVAHTEFGAYAGAGLSEKTFGQFLVMGALDSVRAGDAGFLVYGLQDSAPEQTQGFYTYPGGVPHAAANYFHTLTTLLASARGRYGPGEKPTFRPASLPLSFSNPSVSHLLLQKPTGEFVAAVWSEPLMTGVPHGETQTMDFGRAFGTVRVYDIQTGPAPLAVLHNARRYTLSLNPSDTYLLVMEKGGQQSPRDYKPHK